MFSRVPLGKIKIWIKRRGIIMDEKSKGQELSEKLTWKSKVVWEKVDKTENQKVFQLNDQYKVFLNKCKTEREGIQYIIEKAEEKGFKPLSQVINSQGKLSAGDKVYIENREKGIVLAVIGQEPMQNGVNIIGSHVDAPRLDLKPNPLYEDNGLALFKTHYYGGIKKYQWLTIPLALHGTIIKKDGSKVSFQIGEKEDDPIFTISDILPHLAKDQMEKKMREAVSGEGLNLLVGSIPFKDEKVQEKVKLAILDKLNQDYGIIEEDFISAEIEAVPAGKAKDVGLDRGLVGGYGQDDRVCVFTSMQAIFELAGTPKHTAINLIVDKEEIGSTGNTGMKSRFLANVLGELINLTEGSYSDLTLRRCMTNSRALSADVNAGIDPNYEGVHEKRNAARIGHGIVLTKYTGSGGKYSTNDANAEFVAEIRNLFNQEGIQWQIGELGKVDQGGGGTIAQFMAEYNMEVLDVGVPLLSMHAPFEIASKADVYMAYKGYRAFFSKR